MERTPDVETLACRVGGPVLVPGDAAYDAARSGFQTAGRHEPAVIVCATGTEDVRLAVEFARANRLPVAVQAAGHGLSVPVAGGVLIATGRMTGVRVDPGARTARVEAGARWADVIRQATAHGLAPLSGSSPGVGAVGYTLAGGLSLLSRRYGYAADHVRFLDVVTADARPGHVTVDTDPDLFWALRGGQGNFAVVTGMDIELVPLAELYGGGLYFDTPLLAEVLRAWRRWTETVPDELTSSVALVPYPDLLAVPEPLRGRHAAHVRIAHIGSAAAGERLVAPLRAVARPLLDTLRPLSYAESGTICGDPAQPHAYTGTNVLLRDVDEAAVESILGLAGPDVPVPCVVQVNHLGGALARPAAVASAVGRRDAQYLLRVLSPLGAAGPGPARRQHRRLVEALSPLSAGRMLGFLFGERPAEEVRAAFGPADYRLLAELKVRYDPDNTFRCNLNIPPAPA
jgi:FAD/FMN-containing dehydrogenase